MKIQESVLDFFDADNAFVSAPEAAIYSGFTIFALVFLAFIVRIAFLFLLKTYQFGRMDDTGLSGETTNIAMAIVHGYGFHSPFNGQDTGPTAWIAPVYPYFVAFVFRFFGLLTKASIITIFIAQSVFSALTIIPILGIAKRTVGRNAGLAAACVWCIFPWFSKWSVTWLWEMSLSALLSSLLLWAALALPESSDRKRWMAFGALSGFSLLVNPALATFIAVSLLWCGFELRGRGKAWVAPLAIAGLSCVIVISPWLARNRVVFGEWVFLRSNFGFEFALGNYHSSIGRGWGGTHPSGNLKELDKYLRTGEIPYIRSRQETAIRYVRTFPREFWALTARRILYFWDGSGMNYLTAIPWYWIPSSFLALSVLLLPALLVAHRKRLPAWPLFFGVLLMYPLPYYLTFSQVRYRHVLEPVMLLLICYGWVAMWEKTKSAIQSIDPQTQKRAQI
jgi:4-amino-4-deoxy-L-arabinose transferase-like glycosyltransferase